MIVGHGQTSLLKIMALAGTLELREIWADELGRQAKVAQQNKVPSQ